MKKADTGNAVNAKHLGMGDEAGEFFHDLKTGIMLLQNGNPFPQAEDNSPGRKYRNLHSGVFAFYL